MGILSFLAAKTRRITLGTSVMVLPYHNPIELAKYSATLDQLSGGRFILGVDACPIAAEQPRGFGDADGRVAACQGRHRPGDLLDVYIGFAGHLVSTSADLTRTWRAIAQRP